MFVHCVYRSGLFWPPGHRFILDKDERARLLKECHKGPRFGHLGTKRTLARVTEIFMWPGVGKDVNNLAST